MNVRAVATVAAVALLVFVVARKVAAAQADPYDARNWQYVPGYVPGSGYYA